MYLFLQSVVTVVDWPNTTDQSDIFVKPAPELPPTVAVVSSESAADLDCVFTL